MDRVEAGKIVEREIERLRRKPYSELKKYVKSKNIEAKMVEGESGVKYYIEIFAAWDGRPGRDLRVFVTIDDGGWRAFSPLSSDFIIAPDGSFIGE